MPRAKYIAAYSASKEAVTLLMKQVAVEYAKHKIICNYVCPGCKPCSINHSARVSTVLTQFSLRPSFFLLIAHWIYRPPHAHDTKSIREPRSEESDL